MYLAIYNAVSFFLGLLLVSTGFFLSGQKTQVYDLYGPTFPMALLIVISIGITVAALVSDTSFYKNSSSVGSCQILIFLMLIVLILSLELSAAVAGLAMPNYVQTRANNNIQRQMAKYAAANSSASPIDVVQRSFHCCGLNSSADWLRHQPRPPVSCCAIVQASASSPPQSRACNSSSLYPAGCGGVIRAWLDGEVRVFASLAVGVCLLQLAGLGATLYRKCTKWRPRLPPQNEELITDCASSGGEKR